jgi:hypothetical protein
VFIWLKTEFEGGIETSSSLHFGGFLEFLGDGWLFQKVSVSSVLFVRGVCFVTSEM